MQFNENISFPSFNFSLLRGKEITEIRSDYLSAKERHIEREA